MFPGCTVKAHFKIIVVSLCFIATVSTKGRKCENVNFENNACFGVSKCIFNDISLNCACKNISSLRLSCENPRKLQALYLDENKINYIDKNTFGGLSNLHSLSMKNNRINKIENHTFKPLENVAYLLLSNNAIKEIESNSFKKLTNLVSIDLENNQLTKIDSGLFTNCSYLWQVRLTENHIKEIQEDSFKENSSVKYFYCSKNRISNVKFLRNFPRLVLLDLSHNDIVKIPINALLLMKNLRTLNLSYNKLEVLSSGTFSELLALENLSLSGNKLKYLGEGPFDLLHKLDHLDLRNNSLKSFSYGINFENRNNVTLYVYIDNNNWCCNFIHQIQQLLSIKLIYYHENRNISNINGVPCWDKIMHLERSTSTTKTRLTKFQAYSYNFTTTATSTTKNLVTSTKSPNTYVTTASDKSNSSTSKQATTTEVFINTISEQNSYTKIPLPEIRINTSLFIIASFSVTIVLIAIIALTVKLSKRRFMQWNSSCADGSAFSKDEYILRDLSPQRKSNFYVTLDAYDTYEEVDLSEMGHIYEEIE